MKSMLTITVEVDHPSKDSTSVGIGVDTKAIEHGLMLTLGLTAAKVASVGAEPLVRSTFIQPKKIGQKCCGGKCGSRGVKRAR